MATSLIRAIRAGADSTSGAAACLCGAILAIVFLTDRPPLSATSEWRADADGDGLTDRQELVIGTYPDVADSDGDGYSDLEERARNSDPLSDTSIPIQTALSVGTCASVDDGVIHLVSAVFGDGGHLRQIDFRFGVVFHGQVIDIPLSRLQSSSVLVYNGSDTQDRLAVLEVAIPEGFVQRFGQLNFFSAVKQEGLSAPPKVSVLSLVDFAGTTVSIERSNGPHNASSSMQDNSTGVVYRPLTRSDSIPSSWSTGQICFQRTTPVGVNGASVVHEVDSADCQPMDTYCSGSECSGSVGRAIELPNPGAIAGG